MGGGVVGGSMGALKRRHDGGRGDQMILLESAVIQRGVGRGCPRYNQQSG